MASAGDWGEIIVKAEGERFVGREQQLESFRQHLSLSKPRYLIHFITGQGGAGKSTLLNRYREMAQNAGFLVVECDEQQRDVPMALGHFAQQLTDLNFPLKRFNERYRIYRQKMREIENDPKAPQGLAATLARTVVRTAFVGGDAIPGVRRGLEYVPRETIEKQASEWVTYLVEKFTNKDELILMREPVPTLTPLFFEDLNEIAQKHKILLCFDNFEAIHPELQEWIVHLPQYKPSLNIRIAIASRNSPGAKWEPLQNVTQTIRIDVFSELEAESFLDLYGVSSPQLRQEIVKLSGRLPVLMSWLASAEGQERADEASLPIYDIVERFLRWITDPNLKQIALSAALPRAFNADVLELLLKNQNLSTDEQAAFDWLQNMPFVTERSDGWYYHDVVRLKMLQYQRQKSPHMYRQMHAALADFYDKLRHELYATKTASDEQWVNEEWQKNTLAYIFHFLTAHPQKHWEEILSLFVIAVRKRSIFAFEIIELLSSEVVYNELTPRQNETVQLLHQKLQTFKNGDLKDCLTMFDLFCHMDGLSDEAKGYAFAYRGLCRQDEANWEKALDDFGQALHYMPDNTWILSERAKTYRWMGDYAKALEDFNTAIALNENDTRIISERGAIYRLMGNYQQALADFNICIWEDEKDITSLARRGETYRLMESFEKALIDFNQAIELDEEYEWAIFHRGQAYRQKGDYQKALADFTRLIQLDNDYVDAIASRGATYRDMGYYEDALADFNQALTLDKKDASIYGRRGETYRLMGDYAKALEDFNTAVALDDQYTYAIGSRGQTLRQMGRYAQALEDIECAIELDPESGWIADERAITYLLLGRYEDGLAIANSAITRDEKDDRYWFYRALIYQLQGQLSAFEHDLQIAIGLVEVTLSTNPEKWHARFDLALYNLVGGNTTLAQKQYIQAIAACSSIKHLKGALDDLNDFLAIQPSIKKAQKVRAKLQSRIATLKEGSGDATKSDAVKDKRVPLNELEISLKEDVTTPDDDNSLPLVTPSSTRGTKGKRTSRSRSRITPID